MTRDYSLAIGGLVGSFSTSCAMIVGLQRIETLIFALFIISISSCMGLILEGRKQLCDHPHTALSIYVKALEKLIRVTFGAALASAFICGFSESTVKVAQVFSMPLMTAGLICTLLVISYLSLLNYLIILGKEQFAVERGR